MVTHVSGNWNNSLNTSPYYINALYSSPFRARSIGSDLLCVFSLYVYFLPWLLPKHTTTSKHCVSRLILESSVLAHKAERGKMKRYGNIYPKIFEYSNLVNAHHCARKGKSYYKDVKMVNKDEEKYLLLLQNHL